MICLKSLAWHGKVNTKKLCGREKTKKTTKFFITAFAITVLVTGLASAQAALTWTKMDSGTTEDLVGVWCSSPIDAFAVGYTGTVLHYAGSTWTEMSSGTLSDLKDVWGISANDVFAVGRFGTILHYNGSTWDVMGSGTENHLFGVWGSSPTNNNNHDNAGQCNHKHYNTRYSNYNNFPAG